MALAVGAGFSVCIALGIVRDAEGEARQAEQASSGDMKRAFIALIISSICVSLIFQSTSVALPKLFNERLFADGGVATQAGALVSFAYLFSAGAQILGGELSDRLSLKLVYMMAQFAQIPVLLVGFFTHNYLLVVIAAFMVSLNAGSSPAENALIARYAPAAWRSRIFGIKFLISLGISSLGVAVVPLVYELTGRLDALFFIFAALAALAGTGASLLPKDRTRTDRLSRPSSVPAE